MITLLRQVVCRLGPILRPCAAEAPGITDSVLCVRRLRLMASVYPISAVCGSVLSAQLSHHSLIRGLHAADRPERALSGVVERNDHRISC